MMVIVNIVEKNTAILHCYITIVNRKNVMFLPPVATNARGMRSDLSIVARQMQLCRVYLMSRNGIPQIDFNVTNFWQPSQKAVSFHQNLH